MGKRSKKNLEKFSHNDIKAWPVFNATNVNVAADITKDMTLVINGVQFSIRWVRDNRSEDPMIVVTGTGNYYGLVYVSGDTVLWDGNDWSNTLIISDQSHSYIGIYSVRLREQPTNLSEDTEDATVLTINISTITELS